MFLLSFPRRSGGVLIYMTTKQQLFILEYVKDFNATQAAIRAGYAEGSAAVTGHDLLRNPNVKHAIEDKMDEIIGDKNSIIVENIRYWKRIRGSETARDADCLKASEMLGRYAGMFTDKLEVKGGISVSFDRDDADL